MAFSVGDKGRAFLSGLFKNQLFSFNLYKALHFISKGEVSTLAPSLTNHSLKQTVT